ncbi:hypothetical protein CH367_06455 [Leptospira barantonii]|uniref:Uncharacterized protein n=1 Tax=Leptospira barantonii TaxID=2023184 RepID=A0ABX4NMJ2_9LEPT|nr:hypothetical protein CH367_06455 [Leptospira barantonii]
MISFLEPLLEVLRPFAIYKKKSILEWNRSDLTQDPKSPQRDKIRFLFLRILDKKDRIFS